MDATSKLHALAWWILQHRYEINIDEAHGCIQVVIPCTRDGWPTTPIIETVSTFGEARRALGY